MLIEIVQTLGQQTVGEGRPVPAVLDRLAGGAEIVIMPIVEYKACGKINDALAAIVGIAINIVGAGIPIHPDAVIIGNVPVIGILYFEYTGYCMPVASEIVGIIVKGDPCITGGIPCPVVQCADIVIDELTADKAAVFKDIVVPPNYTFAVNRPAIISMEEIDVIDAVVLIGYVPPTGLELAVQSVIEMTVHREQLVQLAEADAVIIEAVVIIVCAVVMAGQALNTRHRYIINEVIEIIADFEPALAVRPVEDIAVGKARIGFAEMTAPLVGVIGIDEGVDTVLLLYIHIAGYVVKGAGAQIDIIAYLAGEDGVQAVVFIPRGIRLRG